MDIIKNYIHAQENTHTHVHLSCQALFIGTKQFHVITINLISIYLFVSLYIYIYI
jgi:hypothetical protein